MHIIDIFLAALPLLLILILMMGFRWNGAKAGTAGWIATLIVALLRFGASIKVLLWAQVRAIFLATYVLYIIWGALLFFRVTEASGALDAMRDRLQRLAPGRALQVLILAWGFASFLQGVGGFGVPVAVVAPLLVGMGIPALDAVILPSLGHAWAISFGSLGSSFFALIAATGLSEASLAPWMAIALGIVCFVVGFMVLWIAGGGRTLREGLAPMLLMATAMSGVQLIAVYMELWNIAAMLGALAGLVVSAIWALIQKRTVPHDASPGNTASLRKALIPYALLLSIIFAEKFIRPLHTLLARVQFAVNVPEVVTARGRVMPAGTTRSISVFGHPGALLIYAGLITFILALRAHQLTPESSRKIMKGMLRSGLRSTLGILAMVGMATTMDHAGMVSQLSSAMATAAGAYFPLVSPFIGALGAFITGSNTNSNVLFGAFQRDVAQALGYSAPLILAIHNAGAAVGSVFAPAKVIVGCSTVGLSGSEGEALRRLPIYGGIIILLLAVLAWLATAVL